jgi:hypothetical protein
MMSAIGIVLKADHRWTEATAPSGFRRVLHLGNAHPRLGEWLELGPNLRVLETYSPEELLNSPHLKKEAWEHLKRFARETGIENARTIES